MASDRTYELRKDVDKIHNTVINLNEVVDNISTSFFIDASSPAFLLADDGESYNPSNITVTAYKNEEGTTSVYTRGELVLYSSEDGVNFTRVRSVTGSSITITPSDLVYYYRVKLFWQDTELDSQTIPVIRAGTGALGEDGLSLFLGNESLSIPTTANGSLKNTVTFDIPVYCFRGTNYHPASYSASGSVLNPQFTITSYTNPTLSNPGSFTIRCSSSPSNENGFLVIKFIVDDDIEVNRVITWSKVKDGLDGEDGSDGVDGDGVWYIYCKTQSKDTAPTPPVNDNEIIKDPTQQPPPGVSVYWYEDPQGVDSVFIAEWMGKRTYDGSTETWSAWEVSLWNVYNIDGAKGDKGDKGDQGIPGNVITGSEIMAKLADQNIDASTIGGLSPSSFLTSDVKVATGTGAGGQGSYHIIRQGNICILTLSNYRYTTENNNPSDTVFITLPEWATKAATGGSIYFPHMPLSAGYYFSIAGNNVRLTAPNVASGTLLSLTGTVTYYGNASTREQTSVSFGQGLNLKVGQGVTAHVTHGSNNTPLSDVSVRFRINGKDYLRKTNSSGDAVMNINFAQQNLNITANYDGGSYYASSSQTITVNVSKYSASEVSIIFDTTNKTATVKGSVSNQLIPLRSLQVIATLNNDEYNLTTDNDGVVYLEELVNRYTGNVSVKIITNNSNTCNVKSASAIMASINQSQDYTVASTPVRFMEGQFGDGTVAWNSLDSGSTQGVNDGRYIVTNVMSSGGRFKSLNMLHGFQIPHTAVIKTIRVTLVYGSMLGYTSMSKGSFNGFNFSLTNSNDGVTEVTTKSSGINNGNFVMGDTGKWRTESWTIDIDSNSHASNDDGRWNTIGVRLNPLTNDGGGYGNNASFAVDYCLVEVIYTV